MMLFNVRNAGRKSSTNVLNRCAWLTSRSYSSSRWNESGRWETKTGGIDDETGSYLLEDKFGDYFKVPNPAKLMTKIICSIGPPNANRETVGQMMDAGMSMVRLNASHGEYEMYEELIPIVREEAEKRRRIIPIMLDTKGPEIRTGKMKDDGVELTMGDTFTFYKEIDGEGNEKGVGTTFPNLATALRVGDVILVDDGKLSFLVRSIDFASGNVTCSVIMGGLIKSTKGVNVPGVPIDLPHLTKRDEFDIALAVRHKLEFIAHSFTRSAAGIVAVREQPGVVENGMRVIAKIETQEALDNLSGIIKISDGIMVARGDLGVEIPLERVCSVQKRMVQECNRAGKPVIVATEMLDSMIKNPRPTRAEASDVANAVFDGTDCVMLSAESSVGKYPVATIQVMNRICKEAEMDFDQHKRYLTMKNLETRPTTRGERKKTPLGEAFSMAAVDSAREIGASLIIAVTRSGETACLLSKHFPDVPILALSSSPKVCAAITLYRGVIPYLVNDLARSSCVPRGLAKATELGLVSHGSRVVLVTGHEDNDANRLESFVVGANIPELDIIPGQRYSPGSSFDAP